MLFQRHLQVFYAMLFFDKIVVVSEKKITYTQINIIKKIKYGLQRQGAARFLAHKEIHRNIYHTLKYWTSYDYPFNQKHLDA